MKIRTYLTESSRYFKEADVIKIDPDRDDHMDVVNALIPSLVKMAYTYYLHDKTKHRDDEMSPVLTKDELLEQIEDLVKRVTTKLNEMPTRSWMAVIEELQSQFPNKLK